MDTKSLPDHFDAVAGAGFGVLGIRAAGVLPAETGTSEAALLTDAQFVWIVVSETLARHDDEHTAWLWLSHLLQSAAFYQPPLVQKVRAVVQNSWSAVAPFLMLTKNARQRFAATFQASFGATAFHHQLVQRVLLAIFDRYDANLFLPGDWLAEIKNDSRYGTSEQACIVKLGLTLKWLAEQSQGDERSTLEQWQQQLKTGVLHMLPRRISRGFAPESIVFEDAVLTLLAVAEWLTYEKSWRIRDYLADTDKRDDERLSDDQKMLAGALYGYIRGYRSVGNWITDLRQRGAIARQSLCLAAKELDASHTSPESELSAVFYGTESGTLSSFLLPYVIGDRYSRNECITRERVANALSQCRYDLRMQLAQGAYFFDITVGQ